jgi:hypothetical protein
MNSNLSGWIVLLAVMLFGSLAFEEIRHVTLPFPIYLLLGGVLAIASTPGLQQRLPFQLNMPTQVTIEENFSAIDSGSVTPSLPSTPEDS